MTQQDFTNVYNLVRMARLSPNHTCFSPYRLGRRASRRTTHHHYISNKYLNLTPELLVLAPNSYIPLATSSASSLAQEAAILVSFAPPSISLDAVSLATHTSLTGSMSFKPRSNSSICSGVSSTAFVNRIRC